MTTSHSNPEAASQIAALVEEEHMVRTYADRQQSFFFFATLALAAAVSIFGTAGGFIYGDYYGRKHAQFDNPELRQHYTAQCYSYIDNQLQKTIKTSFDRHAKQRDQSVRLEGIRSLLVSLQMDVSSLGHPKKRKDSKRKVASNP